MRVFVNGIANTLKKLKNGPHTLVDDLRTISSNPIQEVENDICSSVNHLADVVSNTIQEVC